MVAFNLGGLKVGGIAALVEGEPSHLPGQPPDLLPPHRVLSRPRLHKLALFHLQHWRTGPHPRVNSSSVPRGAERFRRRRDVVDSTTMMVFASLICGDRSRLYGPTTAGQPVQYKQLFTVAEAGTSNGCVLAR